MALSPDVFIDLTYYNAMAGTSIVSAPANVEYSNWEATANFVAQMFRQLANRPLKARDYSPVEGNVAYSPEFAIFDGVKGWSFFLPTYPVNSINELMISGTVISKASATEYDESDKYYLVSPIGKIFYYGGFNFGERQNVKVTWNGGYSNTSPEYEEFRFLEFSWIRKILNEGVDLGSDVISETLGIYKYQKMNPADLEKTNWIPPFVYRRIMSFRRVPIG